MRVVRETWGNLTRRSRLGRFINETMIYVIFDYRELVRESDKRKLLILFNHMHKGDVPLIMTTSHMGDESLDEINFRMSTSAKYLLISTFLASRNPATLDAYIQLEDPATVRQRENKLAIKHLMLKLETFNS